MPIAASPALISCMNGAGPQMYASASPGGSSWAGSDAVKSSNERSQLAHPRGQDRGQHQIALLARTARTAWLNHGAPKLDAPGEWAGKQRSAANHMFVTHVVTQEAGWDNVRSETGVVKFSMELISPLDREKLAASVMADDEQFAEIHQEGERPTLELYPRRDGEPWRLDAEEAIAALLMAKARLLVTPEKVSFILLRRAGWERRGLA